MSSINEYAPAGDSLSLAKIDGKPFTITAVEESNYEEGSGDERKVTPGVKITTQESFKIDGNDANKFHTTRTAVVSKLLAEGLNNAINEEGKTFTVKCAKVKSKNGRDYFDLVDA